MANEGGLTAPHAQITPTHTSQSVTLITTAERFLTKSGALLAFGHRRPIISAGRRTAMPRCARGREAAQAPSAKQG